MMNEQMWNESANLTITGAVPLKVQVMLFLKEYLLTPLMILD